MNSLKSTVKGLWKGGKSQIHQCLNFGRAWLIPLSLQEATFLKIATSWPPGGELVNLSNNMGCSNFTFKAGGGWWMHCNFVADIGFSKLRLRRSNKWPIGTFDASTLLFLCLSVAKLVLSFTRLNWEIYLLKIFFKANAIMCHQLST